MADTETTGTTETTEAETTETTAPTEAEASETEVAESATTATEPGTELATRDDDAAVAGGEHAAVPLLPGGLRPHPEPLQYVLIALVLVVVTGLEVWTSYLDQVLVDGAIIALLLVFAVVKFFLVASWYMHLRTDSKIFRRFFVLGATGAITLYLVVLLTLHVFGD